MKSYFSNLLETVTLILGIIGLFSQYIFRNEIKQLLQISNEVGYYDAVSIFSALFGILIFAGIYSNRHFLLTKFYLDKKGYKKWQNYIISLNEKAKKTTEDDSLKTKNIKIVLEPELYLNGFRVATLSIILSVFFFILILFAQNSLWKTTYYFFSLITFFLSSSILSLLIYSQERWGAEKIFKRRETEDKIKKIFSPDVKIIKRNEEFNWKTSEMLVMVTGQQFNNQIYKILVDKNDPDTFISIQLMNQQVSPEVKSETK